jgi:hypothetical protein
MLMKSLLQPYLEDDSFPQKIKNVAGRVGFDTTDWLLVVMYRNASRSSIASNRNRSTYSKSPEARNGGNFNFKSYTSTDFRDFDICAETLDRQFDLIIADQVFEHLPWPMRAG